METLLDATKDIKEYIKNIKEKIEKISSELLTFPEIKGTIVVKNIKGNLYYYNQWNEEGKTINKSLGRVKPGAIADLEKQIITIESLQKQLNAEKRLLYYYEKLEKSLMKETYEKMLEEYSFEVFWKNELISRVKVESNKVKVSRYTTNPVKQLFCKDEITRDQLNQILLMRFFERERADYNQKLEALGVKNKSPYEIIKKTHGVSYNDFIWFRFPSETYTYEDVSVR